MRVGVVTTRDFEGWDERSVIVGRLAGALACLANVDMVIAQGAHRSQCADGAIERIMLPSRPSSGARAEAVETLIFGPPVASPECGCLHDIMRELADAADPALAQELLASRGGDSPDLFDLLDATVYDVVAFVGFTEATCRGLELLAGRLPTLVVPLAHPSPALALNEVRKALALASAVLTTSDFERAVVERAAGIDVRVEPIGSVLRVHDLALDHEPTMFEDVPVVVVARDWSAEPASPSLILATRRLNALLAGTAAVRLIGPGWEGLPSDLRVPHADSRLDVWRWMCRATALWDPEPNRILAREVLESFQYGRPVLVREHGAGREHAELGNGGLWYRTFDELAACVQELVSPVDVADTLGAQGRAYAQGNYGDTDAYVDRVRKVVESIL